MKPLRFPVIADCICPDIFQDKTLDQIKKLKVWEGNKQKELQDLFKIEETIPSDETIMVQGNACKVRRIGWRMTNGEIAVNGNAGSHLGEEMKGGKITVQGDTGGWTASMMKGGEMVVHGNAGDYLGAPYRGSKTGIGGGQITVYGNVGSEVGAYMRHGSLRICGCAGQFVGFRMSGGTIHVLKDCGERAGACMAGGRIIVEGQVKSVLPTFTIDSIKPRVKVEEGDTAEGPLYVFIGDLAEDGRGKLYVHKDRNPHLRKYEIFL